jgi:beta-glucosidase
MVLLRNAPVGGSPVLPLDRAAVGSIAVVGPNAEIAVLQGGGSSRVKPHSTLSPLDAITAALGPDCTVRFERGASNDAAAPALDDRLLEGSLTTTYHPIGEPDAPSWTTETHPNLALTWYGDPPPGVPTNEFTVVVRGTVRAPDAGRYSFGLTAVGRSRLVFAGTELVDNWTDPRPGLSYYGMGTEIIEAAVDLEAGVDYEFVVEYERHRDARLGGLTLSCRRPHNGDAARRRAVQLAANSDVVIVVAGTNQQWETEGYDRVGIGLPGDQDELIREVAAANPRTVVVLNTGAPVLTPWADDVAALLQMWFPGYEGSAALGEVLFGDTEPRGRLPFTIPQRIEDTPGFLTDFGEAGRHRYPEGVFVGHRWYQARSIRPAWWFGHGLGYTTSEFGDATIVDDGRQLTVAVPVTNTGHRDGSEVVQVYATRPATGSLPSECVLIGYERIDVEAGATATATIVVAHERLQTWIPDRGWTLPSGTYTIRVGTSLGGPGREYEVDVAGPL